MPQAERIDEILSYIHEHYKEKITADQIAAHINVSRGECFRCFKRHMDKSIVDYTNEYRLQAAVRLLRETDMKIVDIGMECGFENANYFGKLFKEAYKTTPLEYRKARVLTENTLLNVNGYDYEYWKSSGSGKMTITGHEDNGTFQCQWDKIDIIVFRGGRKFEARDKTYDQLGNISLQYAADHDPYGNSWLCVYGWMVEPLTEWYIIEHFSTYKPPNSGDFLGTFEADGGTYELWNRTQINQPTILNVNSDFKQYWSVRQQRRTSGAVDVSAHFRAWEKAGLPMGKLTEVSLSIESWVSSGTANVHSNVLTIS